MNKELYIKREKLLEELIQQKSILNALKYFLKESENKFQNPESIDALINIKKFYESQQIISQEYEFQQKEIYKELFLTCKHEVAIKYSNIPNYECLICKCNLEKYNILKESLISIDITQDYKVAYIIEDCFKEIVYSDKELIETISNLIEEIQYDRDIKVYRRSK